MQRLARFVPIVVVLFVVLVAAVLVTRSRSARVESQAPPSAADLSIKEVEIEEQSGGVRWHLKADQALVFEDEGRTSLRNIQVVVRDKDREWTIRADEGDVVQRAAKRRDVEARRNVVVTSSDGMRLETTVLRWDAEGKRLWTDRPVRVVRAGSIIEGKAFDLRMHDETATINGRVRAQFEQDGMR
jgi:LPS export ABC transporter protein LptC